jgi:hypothetical protein
MTATKRRVKEAPVDEFLNREVQNAWQRLTRTEVAILRDRKDLAWVVNGGPVRPATDEEKARYEGQRTSASFADLMAIQARAQAGEDEPLLPESFTVADVADVQALCAADMPEEGVIEGQVVPDEAGLLEIQHDAEQTLARWGGKPSDLHSVPALDADTAGMTAILPEAGQ